MTSVAVKVLERAGLVTRGRRAQFRPCVLDPAPLVAASAWADQQRVTWEDRLDRLDDHLARLTDPDGSTP